MRSPVTAAILPAPTPPKVVQPRVVPSPWGMEYRFVNGQYEGRVTGGGAWRASTYNHVSANRLDAQELAMLADLKANPTEDGTPPPAEDTVVLTMPRSTAETLAALTGNVIGRGPVRQQMDDVFDTLDSALDPNGMAAMRSVFDDATHIRQELQ